MTFFEEIQTVMDQRFREISHEVTHNSSFKRGFIEGVAYMVNRQKREKREEREREAV